MTLQFTTAIADLEIRTAALKLLALSGGLEQNNNPAFNRIHVRDSLGRFAKKEGAGRKQPDEGATGVVEADFYLQKPVEVPKPFTKSVGRVSPKQLGDYAKWVAQQQQEEWERLDHYDIKTRLLISKDTIRMMDSFLKDETSPDQIAYIKKKKEEAQRTLEQAEAEEAKGYPANLQNKPNQILGADPKEMAAALEANANLQTQLKAQGIDPKAAGKAIARLGDGKGMKSVQEVFLRKADLVRFNSRLSEIGDLSQQLSAQPGDPADAETLRKAIQVRVMAVQSEIQNGPQIDRFMQSKRTEGDRKAFMQSIRQPGSLQASPISGKNREALSRRVLLLEIEPERAAAVESGFEEVGNLYPTDVKFQYGNFLDAPCAYPDPSSSGGMVNEHTVNVGSFFDAKMVAMHEATHIYENQADLQQLSEAYIQARTITPTVAGSGYRERDNPEEYPLRSKLNAEGNAADVPHTDFSVPYTGTVYKGLGQNAGKTIGTEVLTVGIEALAYSDSLRSRITHDRELLTYTLAAFDSANVKPKNESTN